MIVNDPTTFVLRFDFSSCRVESRQSQGTSISSLEGPDGGGGRSQGTGSGWTRSDTSTTTHLTRIAGNVQGSAPQSSKPRLSTARANLEEVLYEAGDDESKSCLHQFAVLQRSNSVTPLSD
jgi:hypothetical protein